MKVNGVQNNTEPSDIHCIDQKKKKKLLFSADCRIKKKKTYRFETTCSWVNDDRIPLRATQPTSFSDLLFVYREKHYYKQKRELFMHIPSRALRGL